MTESTTAGIPAQAGPPMADTSDMAQVHKVFREAVASAPSLIGAASAAGVERVERVATYYDNVLGLLHAHHGGEDVIIWPRLRERAVDQVAEIDRIAAQHEAVNPALDEAHQLLAAWLTAGDTDSGAAFAAAVARLGAVLLPHLDEEERFIVPLAAQHMTAPEWGELPGHAMQQYGGDKLWLVLGLIREQMRPDQITMMNEHMPPPVAAMWFSEGEGLFADFVGELRRTG